MTRQILNRHHAVPGNWVYVGRGSFLGNPFRIGKDGTREEVIEKYREWFAKQWEKASFRKKVNEYVGDKDLMCYCAPEACHAEVIREFVDE